MLGPQVLALELQLLLLELECFLGAASLSISAYEATHGRERAGIRRPPLLTLPLQYIFQQPEPFFLQGDRVRCASRSPEIARQAGDGPEGVGVLWAQLLPLPLQCLFQQPEPLLLQLIGIRRAAGIAVNACEVVHRQESAGMLRTEFLAVQSEGLLVQRDRFGRASCIAVSYRQAVHRGEGTGMVQA